MCVIILNTQGGNTMKIEDFLRSLTTQNTIQELITSPMYIQWLNYFTQMNQQFYTSQNFDKQNEVTEIDKNNIKKLGLFYEGIKVYADENYLYPIPCESGHFYKIRFNNVGYIIGVINQPETYHFCIRVNIICDLQFIDFMDILNNTPQPQVNEIFCSLNLLSTLVKAMHENGVPAKAIQDTVNNLLQPFMSQEEILDVKSPKKPR